MLHDITMLFTLLFKYFASFIGYKEDIIEVIFNLHVQEAKFGGKKDKFSEKYFKKLNSAKFIEFLFSKSDSVATGMKSRYISMFINIHNISEL